MRRLATCTALTLLGLMSLRCGGAEPGATTPTASATPSATSTASEVGTGSPVATASATSTAPTPPASPFTAVAPLPAAGRFFSVDGALLVAWTHPEGTGYGLRAIVDGAVAAEPTLDLQIGTFNLLVGVTGTYPKSLAAVVIGSTGRTGIAEHYVQAKDGWTLKKGTEGYYFAGYANTKDALVALRAPSMPFTNTPPKLDALRGTAGGRAFSPIDKATCKIDPNDPFGRSTAVRPVSFGGTGAGTFFAFGTQCDDSSAIEIWPAGERASKVVATPGGVGGFDENTRYATNAGDTAWAFAEKALFFDGKTWSTVPNDPGIVGGALAADGTLWALGPKGALFKGTASSGFTPVAVPNDAAVDDVGIASDGAVWISAGNALLSTAKPKSAASVDVAKSSRGSDAKRKGPPKFGGPACKSNVVILYGFTKVTPDDYDFPLTRKALKGRTEFAKTRFVVTKDNGQKFFSAMVPSFDEGKKLVAIIEKNVQGSRPQIVCAEPEVVRELKLDLATGEVAK